MEEMKYSFDPYAEGEGDQGKQEASVDQPVPAEATAELEVVEPGQPLGENWTDDDVVNGFIMPSQGLAHWRREGLDQHATVTDTMRSTADIYKQIADEAFDKGAVPYLQSDRDAYNLLAPLNEQLRVIMTNHLKVQEGVGSPYSDQEVRNAWENMPDVYRQYMDKVFAQQPQAKNPQQLAGRFR